MDRMAASVPADLLDLVWLPLGSLHGCRNLSLQATAEVYCRMMETDVHAVQGKMAATVPVQLSQLPSFSLHGCRNPYQGTVQQPTAHRGELA